MVPVGETGTIPYSMRGEDADFPGGSNQMAVDGDTSTCGPLNRPQVSKSVMDTMNRKEMMPNPACLM